MSMGIYRQLGVWLQLSFEPAQNKPSGVFKWGDRQSCLQHLR
jgi:hypothetical protein